MYQGALCFQGLDTLSRKVRAPKAEVIPIISYLASASFSQTCERFTLSGHLKHVLVPRVIQWPVGGEAELSSTGGF